MSSTRTTNPRADTFRVASSTVLGTALTCVGVVIGCNCFPDWTSYSVGVFVLALGVPSAVRVVRSSTRTWSSALHLVVVVAFGVSVGAHVAATASAMRGQERLSGSYWHRSAEDHE